MHRQGCAIRSRRSRVFAGAIAATAALLVNVAVVETQAKSAPQSEGANLLLGPKQNAHVTTHAATVVDGSTWSVRSHSDPQGARCAFLQIPGGGQGGTCFRQEHLVDRELAVISGSSQREGNLRTWDAAWVWGLAKPRVRKVELQMTNCDVIDVPVDSAGIFLHVVPADLLAARVWPHRLIARDDLGVVMDTHAVKISPTPTMGVEEIPRLAAGCG
jgi:hypothetical protein